MFGHMTEFDHMIEFNKMIASRSDWTNDELMAGISYLAICEFGFAKLEHMGIPLLPNEIDTMSFMRIQLEAIAYIITNRESYARGEQF